MKMLAFKWLSFRFLENLLWIQLPFTEYYFVLGHLHCLINLHRNLERLMNYYPHFRDRDIEAQRG